MNKYIGEWHVAHVIQAHEHHARHPQGDDVTGGHQARARIVVFETVRMPILAPQRGLSRVDHGSGRIRPAEGTHGPQTTGEPGVEDIWILLQAKRRQGRQQLSFGLRIAQTDQDLHRSLRVSGAPCRLFCTSTRG
jgi:hypothetical protein